MSVRAVLGSMFLIFAVLVSGCDSGVDADKFYERGYERYQKGDLRGAVVELKNALSERPEFADARELLGQVYAGLGQGELAEKELLEAQRLGYAGSSLQHTMLRAILIQGRFQEVLDRLETLPATIDPTVILVLRGGALFGLQEYAAARRAFIQALEIEPELAGARRGLAEVALSNGNLEEATRQIEIAAQQNPDDPFVWHTTARIADERDDPEAALAAYERLAELTDGAPVARVGAARSLLMLNRPDEAINQLSALDSATAGDPSVLHLRALAALAKDDGKGAVNFLRDALAADPSFAPSQLLLARLSYDDGHYAQADDLVRRYVAQRRDSVDGRVLLAMVRLASGAHQDAVAPLEEVLARNPDHVIALSLLGSLYTRMGEFGRGNEMLERAVAAAPDVASLRTELARGYFGEGNVEDALSQFREALKVDPAFVRGRYLMALAELRAGQYEAAVASARELVEQATEDSLAWNLLGAALEADDALAEAREAYERAANLAPQYEIPVLNLMRLDVVEGSQDAAQQRGEAFLAQEGVSSGSYAAVAQRMARLALAAGDREGAAGWYRRIIDRDPAHSDSLVALASLRASTAGAQASVELLERARAQNPSAFMPRRMLASFYLSTRQPQLALAPAREAVELAPDDVVSRLLLSLAKGQTGDVEGALDDTQRLVERDPENARVRYELGRWLAASGDLNSAVEQLERAVDLDPEFIEGKFALGEVQIVHGDTASALAIARRLQVNHPQAVSGFNLEAQVHVEEGDLAAAEQVYEKALQLSPRTQQALRLYHTRTEMGRNDKAVAGLRDWLLDHPNDADVRSLLGSLAQREGRHVDALRHYMAALDQQPDNIVLLNNIAWTHYLEGQLEQGLTFAAKASAAAGGRVPTVEDTHGWLLVQTGALEQGLRLLAKAASAAPDDPGIRYHHAYALWKAEQREQALEEVEAALATDQDFPEREKAQELKRTLTAQP